MLFFRVNSMKDTNHGAGKGKEIEPHLYMTEDGEQKRFFDSNDINKFFSSFATLYINEEPMARYDSKKIVWRGTVKVNK